MPSLGFVVAPTRHQAEWNPGGREQHSRNPPTRLNKISQCKGPGKTQDQLGGQMMVLKNIGIWWRGETHSRCTKKPNDRIRSANRLRILARGYKRSRKTRPQPLKPLPRHWNLWNGDQASSLVDGCVRRRKLATSCSRHPVEKCKNPEAMRASSRGST